MANTLSNGLHTIQWLTHYPITVAWVTGPEGPKGAEDELGVQRAPRTSILHKFDEFADSVNMCPLAGQRKGQRWSNHSLMREQRNHYIIPDFLFLALFAQFAFKLF